MGWVTKLRARRAQRRAERAKAKRQADPQPYLERLADTHVDQFTKEKGQK